MAFIDWGEREIDCTGCFPWNFLVYCFCGMCSGDIQCRIVDIVIWYVYERALYFKSFGVT
jgi:hypothetical protein